MKEKIEKFMNCNSKPNPILMDKIEKILHLKKINKKKNTSQSSLNR